LRLLLEPVREAWPLFHTFTPPYFLQPACPPQVLQLATWMASQGGAGHAELAGYYEEALALDPDMEAAHAAYAAYLDTAASDAKQRAVSGSGTVDWWRSHADVCWWWWFYCCCCHSFPAAVCCLVPAALCCRVVSPQPFCIALSIPLSPQARKAGPKGLDRLGGRCRLQVATTDHLDLLDQVLTQYGEAASCGAKQVSGGRPKGCNGGGCFLRLAGVMLMLLQLQEGCHDHDACGKLHKLQGAAPQ
jgi:hypothetical protein